MGEEGVVAKLELAQPVAGLRGRERHVGFRQLFCQRGERALAPGSGDFSGRLILAWMHIPLCIRKPA